MNQSGQVGPNPVVIRACKELGLQLMDSNTYNDGDGTSYEKDYSLISGTKSLAVWFATDGESGHVTMSLEFKDTTKPAKKSDFAYIQAKTDKQVDAMIVRLKKLAAKVV